MIGCFPTYRSILVFFVVCSSTIASAQTTKVSGTVTDARTGESLPFVNVAFVDSKVGVTSNFDGAFTLETYYPTDSIRATAVGYVAITVAVKKDKDQVIDLKMTAGLELAAVEILPVDENPAFAVLRKVVRHKPVNNREKLAAYQYDAYNKVEFDINNITKEFTERKLFRPFAFIFDHIDSTDAKPYLPIFMTETLSEVYYRQKPKTQKEFIRGTKVSGIENESVSQFMGDMYQNVNIYENFLVVFGKNFISPIADGGKGYYDYYLTDSAYVGKFWCYKIEFKPKRDLDLAFKGQMWINDTTYAVKRIEAAIGHQANLNLVQSFSVVQEYDQVQREVWMLTRDELVVDLNIVNDRLLNKEKPVQGFYGRRTATYRDFKINEPKEPEFYEGVDRVVMEIDPLSLGADYWNTNRHVQLSAKENAIYDMVDTMKTIPRFRTYVDLITMFVTGYYAKGKVEIGPYSSIFSYNQVEGPRLRFGLRTSNEFSTWIEFEGFTAYGFKDERFKFGLATRGFISKSPRFLYRVAYKHDVEQLGLSATAFGNDNLLGSVFRRGPNNKLTDVEEWRVGLEREWFSGFSNEVRFRFRTLQALGALVYERPIFEPTFNLETVGSIRTAEVSLNTHFAYKEKFVSGEFDRISVGYNAFPTLELHLAYGIPRTLQSDYEYIKVVGRIYKRWQLGTLGWSRTTVEGGKIYGSLPYPLLFIHSGNNTWYYNDEAFNTMNFFEFLSDRYIQVFAEHHFDGLFFNRIPLFRRLKWREVVTFKGVAGDLDPKHTEVLILLPGMFRLSNGPFMEVSAGIENILKVIRVDVVWRLRYNDHPQTAPFAIRGKFVFNF